MKIYFITCYYPVPDSGGDLYRDLMVELVSRGHEVHVFRPDETRYTGAPTTLQQTGVSVTSIPTGTIRSTNPVQKILNTMLFEHRLASETRRQADTTPPDLVIFATPPIHTVTAVRQVKEKTKCVTYLLLKDIFPANGADLGMFPRRGLLWNYFRNKEAKLYQVADFIGCMSQANKNYLEKHNPWIDSKSIEICPNSISPTPVHLVPPKDPDILRRMDIPKVSLNLIYGGNLGKPQGIDFLQAALEATRQDPDIHFTVVGAGTEFHKLRTFKETSGHPFRLIERLHKQEYHTLLAAMDAGLILPDRRFTIPNFPSRLLDYLDYSLPVLAATDVNTDVGTFLQEEGCGFWCESGDLQGFRGHLNTLKDPVLRQHMGLKARDALETHFTVKRSADIILAHMK